MIDTFTSARSEYFIRPKYRPDIDGLRAIAVLAVVGFHAFPDWITGGFIGVDIFFVISGFLISTIIFSSLRNGNFSFVEFYSRRIRRIFPALLLILIASFTLGWFLLLPSEYKQLSKHIAGGAGFISNFLFWNESGYFDNSADKKPLLHLWSLGIEEQFYILWPLLLWLAWRQKFDLLKLTMLIAATSFFLNIAQSTIYGDWVAAFYSPQTRIWELLAGAVLAHVSLQKENTAPALGQRLEVDGKRRHSLQSLLGAVLIAVGFRVITKESILPGWWAVLPILGTVLIISAGPRAWLNRLILSNRVLVWLGLISFPLYLWHWPLLSFARIAQGQLPSVEIRFATVIFSIVLAWLTYRLLEKPVRSGKHGKEKALALTMMMITVGYIGFYSSDDDGPAPKLPKIVQDLIGYKYQKSAKFEKSACSLGPSQDYSAFTHCAWQDEQDTKPSLLLWGDSNAEHLYAGYKDSFGGQFEIVMRTASLCPPIMNMEIASRPHCKKINDYIFESIRKNKPEKVVLAAIWNEYDWKKIESTINQLRKIGITNIDVIGPVPRWTDNLPRLLYLKYRSDALRQIPERMKFGLRQDVIELDQTLANYSKQLKVNYVSAIKILCDEHGCITRLGETGDTLTAYDHVHLTVKSSQFLVSRFPKTDFLLRQ
jgi:peptidoglycan/LPS O-acetylase OafA/YrhL